MRTFAYFSWHRINTIAPEFACKDSWNKCQTLWEINSDFSLVNTYFGRNFCRYPGKHDYASKLNYTNMVDYMIHNIILKRIRLFSHCSPIYI